MNQKHLNRAHQFYEDYGGVTIILARFIPIVRTFAPFVAGIGKMTYSRFAIYNVTGGAVWILLFLLGGWWFGSREIIQRNFKLVIVAIVVISVLPAVYEMAESDCSTAAVGPWSRKPRRPPRPLNEQLVIESPDGGGSTTRSQRVAGGGSVPDLLHARRCFEEGALSPTVNRPVGSQSRLLN